MMRRHAQRAVVIRRAPGVHVRRLHHPAHQNQRDADDPEKTTQSGASYGHPANSMIPVLPRDSQIPPLA
jgi:hypothetical protein